MIPIYQRIIDPERGDCQRAAVASILDLALGDVPEDITTGFAMERFLGSRGLSALHLETCRLAPRPEGFTGVGPWDARHLVRYDYAAGALALASVPSQLYPGGWHAIIVRFAPQPGGWVEVEVAHDPNPRNGPYDMAETQIRSLTFFIPRSTPREVPDAR